MRTEPGPTRHPNTQGTCGCPCHSRPGHRRCEASHPFFIHAPQHARADLYPPCGDPCTHLPIRRLLEASLFPHWHAKARLGLLTHVCRRWRQVALDDPTLWTHFSNFPRTKDWIAERLSRARNAPLVIDLVRSMVTDMFYLFTPHISHTRELYLYDLSFLHSE